MNSDNFRGDNLYDVLEDITTSTNPLIQERFYQTFFLFLLEAKRQAEQQNKAKSDLIACVSHELRTPLTAMLGMAYLLNREICSPLQQKVVKDIIQSGELLLSLINDLLDAAKLEAGKMKLQYEPLELKKLIDESVKTISYCLQGKGLELVVEYPVEVPRYVLGDKKALYQVMLNLLSNAVKFTDKGYIKVRVNTLQQTMTEAVLAITIEDTGIGIPEDQLPKLFNRFEWINNRPVHPCVSTGLGLSISKSYVEQMSGHIAVKSVVDKGSVFTITIPFKLSVKELATTVTQGVQAKSLPYLSRGAGSLRLVQPKLKVLLIEDNEVIYRVHRAMLEELDCVVDCAFNGREAIQKIYQVTYACIFMDIGLPDLSGFEVATKIRESKNLNQKTAIIGLTNYQDKADHERALCIGMNDVIVKPVSLTTLQSVIAVLR